MRQRNTWISSNKQVLFTNSHEIVTRDLIGSESFAVNKRASI